MSPYFLKENPFHSFWMGGFECTDQLNAFGNRVDFLNITGHLPLINEDYERLHRFNIGTVREGIRWSQVEKKPYEYDWSEVAMMIAAAKANNIQQVWDLCHFGFPEDVTPLHPMFARRFAALCKAFAQFYRSVDTDSVLIVTPINEVSFLSWLGGEACGTSPYARGMGWDVKYRLMKAYIEGIEALKSVDQNIRILTAEPLISIVPPLFADGHQRELAIRQHEDQFQVLDILSGRICSELRGKPEYLDILGFNYYYNNQWVSGTNQFLLWENEPFDERFTPLSQLLIDVYHRYQTPIILAETGHPKEDRPLWIDQIADECVTLLRSKIPFWGVCLYPLIDRPDWDHLDHWHQSGLWDNPGENFSHQRILHEPSAYALLNAQSLLSKYLKNAPLGHYPGNIITSEHEINLIEI